MTDKEKYEQALEVAKETYDKQPMYREWLEKMFPELKEPKDERIRRELVAFLEELSKLGKHTNFDRWKTSDCANWIVWLENIPYTIDHEEREGFHLGYRAGFEKQVEQKPTNEDMKTLLRTEYEKGRADAIAEMQKELNKRV